MTKTPTDDEMLREYWLTGLHPDSPASAIETNAANRLLVAARDAFAANGYKGTTTRDIAAGAGMSPAAMYIHYASKQEMLFKLSLLGHGSCYESLLQAVDMEAGPRRRLRAAVYDFTYWHAKHHVISRTIQYELKYLDEENYRPVAEVRRKIHSVVEGVVLEGVRTGDFAVGDVSTTTLAILSMAIDTVRWFPSRSMSDPATLAAHYSALADRLVSGQS
ncbi:TetR/AcrR family transcriptional regulator [Rhodococcus qingshengii]|uniref:TetR/AcrR family transcriptional regulator n=1 Tax=Rhodococcus qingshengii TaxID=334542 RepID=UPI001FD0BA9F|nr:TetR/AcrR family transcriptional regulator [Rhodococcus qingshengii]